MAGKGQLTPLFPDTGERVHYTFLSGHEGE